METPRFRHVILNLHNTLCKDIMSTIGSRLHTTDRFYDFAVIVEGVTVKCNSLILTSCSEYFSRLLETDMLEKRSNEVHLEGMSKETFQAIWTMISSGTICITEDNVVDIWYATDRLHIPAIFQRCEEFLAKTMDLSNYCDLYLHARALDSQKVIGCCLRRMRENFLSFCDSGVFLKLPYEHIEYLIKNRILNAPNEDHVVNAIFKWVEGTSSSRNGSETRDQSQFSSKGSSVEGSDAGHEMSSLTETPQVFEQTRSANPSEKQEDRISEKSSTKRNFTSRKGEAFPFHHEKVQYDELNRLKYLSKLLRASRLCFVSSQCLTETLNRTIQLQDKETLEVVQKAVEYQMGTSDLCQPWTEWTIHREASQMNHGMVFLKVSETDDMDTVLGLGFQSLKKWGGGTLEINRTVLNTYNCKTKMLVANENDVFLYTCKETLVLGHRQRKVQEFHLNCYKLKTDNSFSDVPVPEICAMAVTTRTLYAVTAMERRIIQFNPERLLQYHPLGSLRSTQEPIINLVFVKKQLLVLYNGPIHPVVEIFCPTQGSSHYLDQIPNLPNNLKVSFGFEQDTFLLHNTGALWKVSVSENDAHFEHQSDLWSSGISVDVYGAVVYQRTLFVWVFAETALRISFPKSVPCFSLSLKVITLQKRPGSLLFPMILPKYLLMR